jgi:hypothetical protein
MKKTTSKSKGECRDIVAHQRAFDRETDNVLGKMVRGFDKSLSNNRRKGKEYK